MSRVVAKSPAGFRWWAGMEARCPVCGVVHLLGEENVPTLSGVGSADSQSGNCLTRWYGIQCLRCGAVLRLAEFVEAVTCYKADLESAKADEKGA